MRPRRQLVRYLLFEAELNGGGSEHDMGGCLVPISRSPPVLCTQIPSSRRSQRLHLLAHTARGRLRRRLALPAGVTPTARIWTAEDAHRGCSGPSAPERRVDTQCLVETGDRVGC